MGYDGKLNIRPAFQLEFIYKDKQRDEVVRTIRKDFPLNVMYWVKSDHGGFELLDGQQRTISICQYVQGDFSIGHMAFHNLTTTEQEQILNYPLMIYICEGTDKEKLDWFKIINIAGTAGQTPKIKTGLINLSREMDIRAEVAPLVAKLDTYEKAHEIDTYMIYQLKAGDETRGLRFESFDRLAQGRPHR